MDPSDLSARLRSFADRIDASRLPSRAAVASELRSVLASLPAPPSAGPRELSSALRSVSDRILASRSPSRSAVARELRRVLASMDQVAAGQTKVVVSDSWTLGEVQAIAKEFGGTDLREGPYGDVGLMVPLDKVEAVQEGGGEFHVFDSWDEASGGDPEYAFEPVDNHPETGDDLIADISRVKLGKSEVREYVPVGKDSPYAVIDGRFEFTLPDGQHCVWDGRLDHDNVDGTLTVDGEDMTSSFLGQGDTPDFSSIDSTLDPGAFDLESVLTQFVK